MESWRRRCAARWAPRLRVLSAYLSYDYDRHMGAALADMMDACAETGATLEFS